MKFFNKNVINAVIFAIFVATYLLPDGGGRLIEGQLLEKSVLVDVSPKEGWIQLAALAVSTGLSIWQGVKQNKAAKKLEQMNERPEYRISRGTLANLALSRRYAEEGLPSEVSASYLNNLKLGVATSLRNNVLYGGRSSNVNSTVRAYNEGLEKLASAEAEANIRNRNSLIDANRGLSEEESNMFKASMQDYQNKANLVAGLRSAGQENIFSGIGAGLGFVASGGLNSKVPNSKNTSTTPATADYANSAISANLSRDWSKLGKNRIV